MTVFGVVLILVAVLAAVVLLFPVVFRMDFRLTESGFVADLFVFKKKLWNYAKEWKAKEEEPAEKGQDETADKVQDETAENTQEKPTEKSPDEPVAKSEPSVEEKTTPVAEPCTLSPETQKDAKDRDEMTVDTSCSCNDIPQTPSPAPETSTPESRVSNLEPEQKKSLTEREFWTLLLTSDIDERGLRYSKKILNSFVNVFQVRFWDCYVEGIRMDYKSMGYGAALNAMLKGYPFLEDWELRMDWTRDHDLQSAGHIQATVNLCRTIWFLTVSSVYGGIFAYVFWRRRAAVLKTGELPELGYVRTKILNWLVEE